MDYSANNCMVEDGGNINYVPRYKVRRSIKTYCLNNAYQCVDVSHM